MPWTKWTNKMEDNMNNKTITQEQPSILERRKQRERAERMHRLFACAEGTEDVSRRKEYMKCFDLGANRYQAVLYSEPVHYYDEANNAWQEINNTLEEKVSATGRKVVCNRANRMRVEFPQQTDAGDMVSITENGRTFGWRFEKEPETTAARTRTGSEIRQERLVRRAQQLPKYTGLTLSSLEKMDLVSEMENAQEQRSGIPMLRAENTYEQVLPGVTVRYTLSGNCVKEDIILDDAEALRNAAIRLPKRYRYQVTDAQELVVYDGEEAFFQIDTPYVYDARGVEGLAYLRLTDCGEYIRLEYILEDDYLNGAVYPVTIDPVGHSTSATTNIQDTTLCQNMNLRPYTQNHIRIGRASGTTCVGLIKFNGLAPLSSSDTVVGAYLQMAPNTSDSSKYIGAYEVLKPWTESTVDWLNFNPYVNAGNISGNAVECVKGSNNSWLSFDLTNLYRKWCTRNSSGVSNNNGVAFRTPDNISGDNYSELYSSNASSSYQPVMYINYVSHAGLESWWEYENMSAGRAGTVYADLFNGNMVLEHSDTVMTGDRNPVSVNHYYNSCRATSNSCNCGYGWKTDAHQKVTGRIVNNTNYYVWEDGDGTEHFFEVTGTQPYSDAEGMDLKLTLDTTYNKIVIYDKHDNGLRFNIIQNGLAYLEAATDAKGNVSTYSYVAGYANVGRLDKITDPAGRVTQFHYNNNGLISDITIPAAEANTVRTVYYTYDSANRLTGIRYSELGGTDPHTTYGYEGTTNLLTLARNYDGIQVNVGYEPVSLYGTTVSDEMRHVLSLETAATDTGGNTTLSGAKQVFEYGAMTTKVTAVDTASTDDGKTLYYQFNDAGNVVCVRDELGFASFTKYESGIENKPSEVSKLRKSVVNRLRRADLSAQWTASAAGGTAALDAANRCLNCKSVKLTKNGTGEVLYRQQVALEAGQDFTLSAYLKTASLTNGGAFLRIRPVTSGAFTAVTSETITGTTAAATGNELPADGWERVRVTLNALTTAANAYVEMVCSANSGTAWFACPQLETGVVANAFNLVSNGDFRYTYTSGSRTLPSDWDSGVNNLTTATTGVFTAASDSTFPEALEGNYVQIEGRPDKTQMGFVQYYDISGNAGDVFVVGGWADGKSIPNATTRDKGFCLALSLKKADGTWINPEVYSFNGEWVGWQQCCYAAGAGAAYTQIALYVLYTGNCNTAKFTNIFLHREAYGTSFGYDSDGNVLSASNLTGQQMHMTYDTAHNVQTYVQPGRANTEANQYWAYYGDTDADKKKHLPWRSKTPMGMTDTFSYDSYGNPLNARRIDYSVITNNTAESAYPYIRTENTYTTDGNYGAAATDARGNVVTQSVNLRDGTLSSITDPANQTVNYTYDDAKRVTEVSSTGDGKTYKNQYTYENDRIKTVSHNTGSDNTTDVTYTFDYDGLGRKTTVKVGTQTLSTNTYENDRNGLLSQVEYGNGGKVKYSYDEFDRMTGVRYDAETADRYTYRYGANGEIAEVEDSNLSRLARTEYDLADRPCGTELKDTGSDDVLYKTRLKYDKLSNLEQFAETVDGETHTSDYTYDRDNRVTEIDYDGTTEKVTYAYDALGRIATRTAENGTTAGKLTSTYSYVSGGYGTNSTTALISDITQSTGAGSSMNFSYTYDDRGNITSETRNNVTTTYEYDSVGQLIRVNDPNDTTSGTTGTTWVYSYDRGGNILSKTRYAYTTGTLGTALETIPYTYGDSNWKDKLTAYNGNTITYDAIGNPLSDGTWTYTWGAGRQLRQMSRTGMTVQFKYDHNGLRTQKIVTENGVTTTTDYTLHGKLVTEMRRGNDILHFFYDNQSRPAKVEYNGTMYTYVHNLQGDIIGILDSTGALVVEYKYDAWGRPLSVAGTLKTTLGAINPFRYRGYVYDEETELYYLRSRFYNAVTKRFMNVDAILGEIGHICSHNVFVYCKNTPLKVFDSDGANLRSSVISAFSSIINAVVGAVDKVVTKIVYAAKCSSNKKTSDAIDLTERLTSEMEKNYAYMNDYLAEKAKKYGAFIAYGLANAEFASKVRSGGEWDFKSSWNLDRGQVYLFNGVEITYQDPGNIHYGYVGSALHTLTDLRIFAGEYQILSKTSDVSYWKTCFDDPDDYSAITYGYLLKQGTYSTAFTSYWLNP